MVMRPLPAMSIFLNSEMYSSRAGETASAAFPPKSDWQATAPAHKAAIAAIFPPPGEHARIAFFACFVELRTDPALTWVNFRGNSTPAKRADADHHISSTRPATRRRTANCYRSRFGAGRTL